MSCLNSKALQRFIHSWASTLQSPAPSPAQPPLRRSSFSVEQIMTMGLTGKDPKTHCTLLSQSPSLNTTQFQCLNWIEIKCIYYYVLFYKVHFDWRMFSLAYKICFLSILKLDNMVYSTYIESVGVTGCEVILLTQLHCKNWGTKCRVQNYSWFNTKFPFHNSLLSCKGAVHLLVVSYRIVAGTLNLCATAKTKICKRLGN